MIEYKNNREVLEEFDTYVHGHEEAKKAIINLVNKSKIRYHQRFTSLNRDYAVIEPSKLLLIGPSGQGKTFLVEIASKIMEFPLLKIDACSLSPTSAAGMTPDKLKDLIELKAKGMINTSKHYYSTQGIIDQMVIFVDEIDKLAKPHDSSGRWSIHTQESFLTLFDAKDEFSGLSFIFAGAFMGIEQQFKTKSLGFVGNENSIIDDTDWAEEIVKFGLIPELVGRLNGVFKLEDLTKKDYKNILVNILLPKKIDELLYYHCTDFYLNPEQIDLIVNQAFKSGQGVRSLKRELNKLVAEIEFYYEDIPNEQLRLEHVKERYHNQSS